LNPDSGTITPSFHFVFDDWFAAISSDELPGFASNTWQHLFGNSTYYLPFKDEDLDALTYQSPNPNPCHNAGVAQTMDTAAPVTPLPVLAPPPMPPPVVSNNKLPALSTPPVLIALRGQCLLQSSLCPYC
jgi:hypothetical protein